MQRKLASAGVFLAVFALFLAAIHRPNLKLPFHWDELGQFVPAATDLYEAGFLSSSGWVAHSTLPNVHPPCVMALIALAWHIFGHSSPDHSILVARCAMLAVASLGALFAFLLAIRLSRGALGAPAFAAVLFLLASPLFYTQSMMVLLDMPAMTLTALALLLFLDERWAWSAAACTLLVLTKETAITTPLVFGAWLWFGSETPGVKRIREGAYFFAPAIALAAWLVVLHRATGHWLGNEEFARFNIGGALQPRQILYSVAERAPISSLARAVSSASSLCTLAGDCCVEGTGRLPRWLRARSWLWSLCSGARCSTDICYPSCRFSMPRSRLPLPPIRQLGVGLRTQP